MIRRYDNEKKQWVILGSGNANSIQLDNPEFSKEDGTPVTVSDGFTIVSDKLDKLEKNVSYIYKNGTLGGGGGGGGGTTTSEDTIVVTNEQVVVSGGKNYLYIGSTSATINFYIKTSGATQRYNVIAKLGTATVQGWDSTTVYSSKNATSLQTISLSEISGNTSLTISAIDSNGMEIESYILYIRSGSYSFSMENYNSVYTCFYNDYETQRFTFNVKNGIPGSTAYLRINCNSVEGYNEGVEYTESSNWSRTVYFYKLLEEAGINEPVIGAEYKISAYVQIQYQGSLDSIESEHINFSVIVANSNSLTVIVTGNSLYPESTVDDEIIGILQDNNIVASIKIIDSQYSLFKLAYKIVDSNETEHIIGDWNNSLSDDNDTVTTNVTKTKSFNPIQLGIALGKYTLTVKAWAQSQSSYSATKSVVGKLVESENAWIPDYNNQKRFICQYNAYQSSQKNPQDTSWICDKTDNGDLFFPNGTKDEELYPTLKNSRTMNIYKTNGQTSGFVNSSLTSNAPALRLSGKAYAMINFSPFIQTSVTGGGYPQGLIQSAYGFTISITFRSDIHPTSNGTILDIGDYDSTGTLSSGLHIGLNEVMFKFFDGTNEAFVTSTIVQGDLNVVDIVYDGTYGDNQKPAIKLFINGVCSDAYYFNDLNSVSIYANSVIWFGSRNTRSGSSTVADANDNFCDVNIYDFKISMSMNNAYGIVRNYINSRTRAELTEDGNLNWTLIKSLREKNFLSIGEDLEGNQTLVCDLCDINNEFDTTWNGLYDSLVRKDNNPIPILFIDVQDSGFYKTYHDIYSTDSVGDIMNLRFNATYTFTDTNGQSIVINSSSEQTPGAASTSPYITLQGTTTMGYSAKNLELYFGTIDGTNERLFTPRRDSWLPENRFTLKADVVDSAHCNNASVGKFINESGVFQNIPPQELGANKYANKVKHTLEGFPIYVFIRYSADDTDAVAELEENINTPQFMGIYSFNLGRGSYFNLGFKVLEEYSFSDETTGTKEDSPALVSTYKVMTVDPYGGGCFSYECLENENEWGSFQTDDTNLINRAYEKKYPEETTSYDNVGFSSFQFLFTILANCYEGDNAVKWIGKINDQGEITPEKSNEYYNNASTYYTATWVVNKKFNWKNANAYYLVSMAFGMVDSLGKNMTLRTWNSNSDDPEDGVWYTCFYDMDTCLGLDNYGSEIVSKRVSTDKYENDNESGFTSIKVTRNYKEESGGYSTYNSRLWNVVTRGILEKDGNIETGADGSFRTLWIDWRTNDEIFKNYENFINNYYRSQIDNIGEITYNLDYKIKYFDPYSSGVDKTSLGFLHGKRVEYVTDWFKDRLGYLDSIFLYDYSKKSSTQIDDSQYLNRVSLRGSGISGGTGSLTLGIMSASPNIFEYTVNTSTARAVVSEDELTDVIVPTASGDTQITFNLKDILSNITNFKSVGWSDLSSLYLSNIENLDLEDMDTLTDDTKLGTTSNSPFSVMTQLRELNLKNMNVKGFTSGIPLVLTNCTKLQKVDISGSDVSSILFPDGGCLEELILNNSKIANLTLTSQPFLTELNFSNCSRLNTISLNQCKSIKTLNFAGTTIQSLSIVGCESLTSLNVSNCKYLSNLNIDACPNLTTINLSSSSIFIDDPNSVTINLIGASGITSLNMNSVKSSKVTLSSNIKKTLTSLNLSNSYIYIIQFDTTEPEVFPTDEYIITDLSGFEKITSSNNVSLNLNTNIKYLKFRNDKSNPFNITSSSFVNGCSKLTRIFGHIKLSAATIFKSLSSFYVNDEDAYVSANPTCAAPGSNGENSSQMDAMRDLWLDNEDSDTGYVTNITLGTTNLSELFRTSGVNILDAYYILSRSANVTSLQYTFRSCTKIKTTKTNPLGRYVFKYCGKVTDASETFSENSNLRGPIFSPTKAFSTSGKYDGVLSPLISATTIDGIFRNAGFEEADTYLLYKPSDSGTFKFTNIKYIIGYKGNSSSKIVKQAGVNSTEDMIHSSEFLKYCPNLTTINHLLGNTVNTQTFCFDTVTDINTEKEVTLFVHNNPNITDVSYLIGAFSNDTELGHIKVTGQITASIFGGSCGGTVTYKPDQDEETTITYNKFPKNITNFNYFLCTDNSGSNVQLDWDDFDDFFNNLNKSKITTAAYTWGYSKITNSNYIKKGIKKNGSNNTEFPINIFKGLTNISDITAFFSDHGIKNNKENPIELPGSMFSENTNLSIIQYLFSNNSVPEDFFVKFTSLGFRNCRLTNVQSAFYRVGTFSTNLSEYSGVPFRFFYMDYDTTIKVYHPDDISSIGSTFKRKVRRNTISNMNYVFYNNDTMGSNQIQYSSNDGGLVLDDSGLCGDFITYNYNYDPRKWILKNESLPYNEETNPYLENINYSPQEYTWDEDAWDGIYRSNLLPTSINTEGAVYIDPDQQTPTIESSEEVMMRSIKYSILNSDGGAVSNLSIEKLFDDKDDTSYSIPIDTYVVFDFGNDGINIEKLTLWNDGINKSNSEVIAVYGKIEELGGIFSDPINIKSLTSIATTGDSVGSFVESNTWVNSEENENGQIILKDIGTYRYLIFYNGTEESHISKINLVSKIIKTNLVNEVVAKYGPYPENYNSEVDKLFITSVVSNEVDIIEGSSSTGFKKYGAIFKNYLFPSDLFRYCSSNCSVISALANLGTNNTSSSTDNSKQQGLLRGRLQPQLFNNLTSTNSFESLFANCYSIITQYLPYTQDNTSLSYSYGEMFPTDLFSTNKSITSIKNMFSYIRVPYNIKLPNNLLSSMSGLLSIEGLFDNSRWGGGDSNSFDQLNFIFNKNSLINTSAYLLRMKDTSGINYIDRINDGCTLGIKYLDKDLFTITVHKNLKNASYMMYGNGNLGSSSTFPELWSFGTVIQKNRCYGRCSSSVSNYKTAEEKGYTSN